MISNNWLFEAVYDWRSWKGQRLRYGLIILGFAAICVLTASVLRLGEMVFDELPEWVDSEGLIYTFASLDPSTGISGISKNTILKAKEVSGVTDVAYIQRKNWKISHEKLPEQEISITYFSDNFVEFTGAPLQDWNPSIANNKVWLSDAFYNKQFNSDSSVIGTQIRVDKMPRPVEIAGILPKSMNQFSSGIWLHADNLRYSGPELPSAEGLPDDFLEQFMDKFLSTAPLNFGFLKTTTRFNPVQLQSAIEAVPDIEADGGTSIKIISAKQNLWIGKGINLRPLARNSLKTQWQMVLGLTLLFTAILLINTFSIFTSKLALMWQELRIMRIVGAGQTGFLRATVASIVPVLLLVLLFSLVLAIAFSRGIEATGTYQEFAGGQPFRIGLEQWAAAILLVFVFLLICKGLPLIRLLGRELFNREVGQSQTMMQMIMSRSNLVFSLAAAVFASGLALSMWYSQWLMNQNSVINQAVIQTQFSSDNDIKLSAELLNGYLPGNQEVAVALADNDFSEPALHLDIKLQGAAESLGIDVRRVSANYLTVLGLDVDPPPADSTNWVILNESAQKQIQNFFGITEVLGQQVSLQTFRDASFNVHAVVANIPHLGLAEKDRPIMYIPINSLAYDLNTAYLYTNNAPDYFHAQLQAWANDQFQNSTIEQSVSIQQLIKERDSGRWAALQTMLILVGFILLTVMVAVGYQLKSVVAERRQELGIYRAVGAPDTFIFKRVLLTPLLAIVFAIPLALVCQWLVKTYYSELGFSLFEPLMFVISVLLSLILLLIATAVPISRVLKSPISEVIRAEQTL